MRRWASWAWRHRSTACICSGPSSSGPVTRALSCNKTTTRHPAVPSYMPCVQHHNNPSSSRHVTRALSYNKTTIRHQAVLLHAPCPTTEQQPVIQRSRHTRLVLQQNNDPSPSGHVTRALSYNTTATRHPAVTSHAPCPTTRQQHVITTKIETEYFHEMTNRTTFSHQQ